MDSARPFDAPMSIEPRPDWDWAYASAGPVVASEVLM
jgi:hypothetical protein